MWVLCMNKGDNETSYAKNSILQNKIISMGKPTMEEAILQMLCKDIPNSIGIADLGCSSGPNTFFAISLILNIIHTKCHNLNHSPELRISLNDLPNNDFNCVFGSLSEFYNKLNKEMGYDSNRCFVSIVAGSFYGRLFPSQSLHFVHSSSSLHWLSQVPIGLQVNDLPTLNKGKLYISKNSPKCVLDAYSKQFKNDFNVFLKSRSEEIVDGGSMVLSFMGRKLCDPTIEQSCYYQWEILAQALMAMAKEGILEEEKIDSFNAPYYAPCPEDVIFVTQSEGSFVIGRLLEMEVDWDGVDETLQDKMTSTSGQRVANTIRAVLEPMIKSHFGEHTMDDLFQRYAQLVDDHSPKIMNKYINLIISFTKKS